ncbi:MULTISPECIES: hypothetical protein [Streptomyces]|uniref:Uncharacterized protein n=2 Tax=Streptomyces TaxID=1883 RepID=A0ABV9IW62_9ACTN
MGVLSDDRDRAITGKDAIPASGVHPRSDLSWPIGKISFFHQVVITVQAGVGKTWAQNEAMSKQPFRDDRRLQETAVVS